ncbi:MAG: hypothetical protein FWG67_02015, partial [Defluviitaleaceae bacterium]|nr:hypothetical protein [Defluviitaleaceae bacterium]
MKKGLLIGAGLAFIALLSGCFGRGSFLTEEDALANLDMHFPDRTFEVVEARRRGKGFDGIGA